MHSRISNVLKTFLPALIFAAWGLNAQSTNTPGTLKWEFALDENTGVVACPAISANGQLYFGAMPGGFFAIDAATGAELWRDSTPEIYSSPTIAPDGTIFQGTYGGSFHAYNPITHLREWSFHVNVCVHSTAAIGIDNDAIFAGAKLYSGDRFSHRTNWARNYNPFFGTRHGFDSSPAVGADGTSYGGSYDGFMYAVDRHGALRWKFKTGGEIVSSPALGFNGLLYFGSGDSNVYVLDAVTGSQQWKIPTGAAAGSPVLGNDGVFYVISRHGVVYSLDDTTGKTNWTFANDAFLNYWRETTPALTADDTLYVGLSNLVALNAVTGARRWEFVTGGMPGSPTVGPTGVIYVGTHYNFGSITGKVMAIHGTAPLANTAWPKFHKDAQNTGRLIVSGPPVIARGPSNRWAAVNGETTFGFYSPTARPLTIQWRRNGTTIAGATNEILKLDPVRFADSGSYSVVISNSAGIAISDAALLQVGYSLTIVSNGPGVISRDPQAAIYPTNSHVVLTATPASNHSFLGWSGAITSDSNSVVLTLQSNTTMTASIPYLAGELKWRIGEGQGEFSTPVVGRDGTLYFVHQRSILYALDPVTKSVLWEYELAGYTSATPALGHDAIYVGTWNGHMDAIDAATGQRRWRFTAGEEIWAEAAISVDGTVYFGSDDRTLYALDGNTGAKKWSFVTGDVIRGAPVVAADGTVIFGSADNKVYALHGPSGQKRWEFTANAQFRMSPSLSSNGKVYIGSYDGTLYALNVTNGLERWRFQTFTPFTSFTPPVVAADGHLYLGVVGSTIHKLISLNGATGALLWERDMVVNPGMALASDGTLYVSDARTQLLGLDRKTGSNIWQYVVSEQRGGIPLLARDGTLYFGTDGGLFVFQGSSPSDPGAWPNFRQSADNRGRAPALPIFNRDVGRHADGRVLLKLHAEHDAIVRVEQSTTLTNWFPFRTYTNSTETFVFDDDASTVSRKFYRARQ